MEKMLSRREWEAAALLIIHLIYLSNSLIQVLLEVSNLCSSFCYLTFTRFFLYFLLFSNSLAFYVDIPLPRWEIYSGMEKLVDMNG